MWQDLFHFALLCLAQYLTQGWRSVGIWRMNTLTLLQIGYSLTAFCGLGSVYMHSCVADSGVGFCTDLLIRLHTGDTID